MLGNRLSARVTFPKSFRAVRMVTTMPDTNQNPEQLAHDQIDAHLVEAGPDELPTGIEYILPRFAHWQGVLMVDG